MSGHTAISPPSAQKGTTAAAALLCPDGQHAVLCNIGDSRVALVGDWTVLDHSGHEAEQFPGCVLTHAHRVTDPEEMERIDAAGEIHDLLGDGGRHPFLGCNCQVYWETNQHRHMG